MSISSRKLDLSAVGFALCVCVVQDVFGGHSFLCAIVLALQLSFVLQLSKPFPQVGCFSNVPCPDSTAI